MCYFEQYLVLPKDTALKNKPDGIGNTFCSCHPELVEGF